MKIWLAYVNFPITTAVYLKRALLQAGHRVTTIGPRLPEEAIELWQLQSLKTPLGPQDIDTPCAPDMAKLWHFCPEEHRPDLYLWVESINGYWPERLHEMNCPKACYLIDSHVGLERHLAQAPYFDYVFIAQLAYLDDIRAVNPNTYWLPLACDPDVHRYHPGPLQHDLTFVGSLLPDTRRFTLLNKLSETIGIHRERSFLDDMAKTMSTSRIVFNNAVQQDLNMRFFEVLSIGSLLLSDLARESGQLELFRAGVEYACYHDHNIVDVVQYYLQNEPLRLKTAENGHRLVRRAHTYRHRMEDLLAVIFNDKQDTWSATELRTRSLPPQTVPTSDQLPQQPVIGIRQEEVPLSLRSVITARAARPHPALQTTVEWGEDFAAYFGIQRHDLDGSHAIPNQMYADNEVDLLFLTLASDLVLLRHNKRLIPIISDVWLQDLAEFCQSIQGRPLVYVTSLEICKTLNRNGYQQVKWMPFSVAHRHLRPQPATDKSIDIIQFGRRNSIFDHYMALLLARFPHIHYVTTTADHENNRYRFASNLHGDLGPSNDRNHFIKTLHSSRISLVSPPGHDDHTQTGGCQVAAIRYFESIACYCHLISRHRDSAEFRLLGLNNLCHQAASYTQFESLVLELQQQSLDTDLLARYQEFQSMHTTRQRAAQLAQDLTVLTHS